MNSMNKMLILASVLIAGKCVYAQNQEPVSETEIEAVAVKADIDDIEKPKSKKAEEETVFTEQKEVSAAIINAQPGEEHPTSETIEETIDIQKLEEDSTTTQE